MNDVTWRPIPGVVHYEACSAGQIRSIDRTAADSRGHVYKRVGRVLKLTNKQGRAAPKCQQDALLTRA